MCLEQEKRGDERRKQQHFQISFRKEAPGFPFSSLNLQRRKLKARGGSDSSKVHAHEMGKWEAGRALEIILISFCLPGMALVPAQRGEVDETALIDGFWAPFCCPVPLQDGPDSRRGSWWDSGCDWLHSCSFIHSNIMEHLLRVRRGDAAVNKRDVVLVLLELGFHITLDCAEGLARSSRQSSPRQEVGLFHAHRVLTAASQP